MTAVRMVFSIDNPVQSFDAGWAQVYMCLSETVEWGNLAMEVIISTPPGVQLAIGKWKYSYKLDMTDVNQMVQPV
jgi:hypothetical protein